MRRDETTLIATDLTLQSLVCCEVSDAVDLSIEAEAVTSSKEEEDLGMCHDKQGSTDM